MYEEGRYKLIEYNCKSESSTYHCTQNLDRDDKLHQINCLECPLRKNASSCQNYRTVM